MVAMIGQLETLATPGRSSRPHSGWQSIDYFRRSFAGSSSGRVTNAGFYAIGDSSLLSMIDDLDDVTASSNLVEQRWERLVVAIEASRTMLDLPDDWDGEGSPAYDAATWQRAVAFLVYNMFKFRQKYGVFPEVPTIDKGPSGSIDLHWQTPTRELLINVPVETSEPIDFYGDDGRGGHRIKGVLDPNDTNLWLLSWLTT